jgi:hypothetical protein
MKKRFGIWLLALTVFLPACQKDGPGGETAAVKDLTVLFTPGHSFSGASYDDGILKVMAECEAAWPNMELHLIRPEDARQASSLIEAWKAGEGADKALILCGPTYESLVGEASPGQGRILIVDSNKEFSGAISTLQMKRYGGAWLAGALSKHLTLTIIKAYDGDRMMDTVAQGIEDGFLEAGGENCLHIVLSDGYEGTSMPDELFNILYANPETYFQTNACLVPVCGASRMGAYAFSNNYFVQSMGIGGDCSVYSDILPFSLINDLGTVLEDYIGQWLREEPWPAHRDFGLATGHVSILYNQRFFELAPQRIFLQGNPYLLTLEEYKALEAQYMETALEKEASHAY